MKMEKILSVGFCFVLVLLSSSCQRGSSIRPDKPDKEAENSQSAVQPSSPSPSQKVEIIGQPKKRVAVLNFWNSSSTQHASLGLFAADELRRGLTQTQKVILQDDIKSTPSTEEFVEGDQIKVAQLIREGRKMGLNVLVVGKINKIIFKQSGDSVGFFRKQQSQVSVEIESKIFDIQEGRELMAFTHSGEASNTGLALFDSNTLENPDFRNALAQKAIHEVVSEFVPEVIKSVEKLAWQGRIAKFSGHKAYINAGKSTGLIFGDILRVLNPGEDIYDPISGAYLGHTPGQLKGTLEVKDFLGQDAAVAEVHTGGNFKEGDVVQLY